VPARAISDEDDVVVGIDESRDHRLSHQVDGSHITLPRHVVTDSREASVANQNLRYDLPIRIHRVNAAIDEREIAAVIHWRRRLRVLSLLCDYFRPPAAPPSAIAAQRPRNCCAKSFSLATILLKMSNVNVTVSVKCTCQTTTYPIWSLVNDKYISHVTCDI
jgi:hypothetical protein